MLRPEMVITYCKARGALGRSDFQHLVDGINVGGRIVVGGDPQTAKKLGAVLNTSQRLGMVESVHTISEGKPLDPHVTYVFDLFTITQMLMITKNEAFHGTIDMVLKELQDLCLDQDTPLELVLQAIRERADQVAHL